MSKSVIFLDEKVENTDRRFGSALEYYPAEIVIGPRRHQAMFTPADISQAIRRAQANPEDVPRTSWWRRLVRALFR